MTAEILNGDLVLSPRPGGLHAAAASARAEPFDAIELELGILWADVDLDTPGSYEAT